MNILLIAIGGSIGSIGRYLINEFFIKYIPAEYPLGILFINILGCFFIGYCRYVYWLYCKSKDYWR